MLRAFLHWLYRTFVMEGFESSAELARIADAKAIAADRARVYRDMGKLTGPTLEDM